MDSNRHREFTVSIVLLAFVLGSCSFKQEKQGGDQPGVIGAELVASYASIRQNILISNKCVSCHTGPDSPHRVDLASYESIMRSPVFPPLIVPGDPDSSSLYDSIKSGRMPKGMPRLSDRELQVVYEWIKAGAREEGVGPNPSPSPEPADEIDDPWDDEEENDE